MKLIIDIPDEYYKSIKNTAVFISGQRSGKSFINHLCNAVANGIPQETVTEFADRCRECGKMRTGHWIYDDIANNWRCDKCSETPKTMGYVGSDKFMAEHFKFCNHCGARMEAKQNG